MLRFKYEQITSIICYFTKFLAASKAFSFPKSDASEFGNNEMIAANAFALFTTLVIPLSIISSTFSALLLPHFERWSQQQISAISHLKSALSLLLGQYSWLYLTRNAREKTVNLG